MRTTIDIDTAVLSAARELARQQQKSLGQVISELTGRALRESTSKATPEQQISDLGFRPLPSRGGVVTDELIDRLRGESGDW